MLTDESVLEWAKGWLRDDTPEDPTFRQRFLDSLAEELKGRRGEETKGPVFSAELTQALDRERSMAYSHGATSVWESLGVGQDPKFPNEAVWTVEAGVYVVRPKTPHVDHCGGKECHSASQFCVCQCERCK